MKSFLKGKKTYIIGLALLATVLAFFMGYIRDITANVIIALLIPLGIISLKAGQSRLDKKLELILYLLTEPSEEE